ncbi:hypothetical protein TruAng_002453 [Truncatella angustata]|nr:hypothetical protein TruAng_002453 [Truncatella angustata]
MASFNPYSYIQCPCYDSARRTRSSEDTPSPSTAGAPDDDDHAFDPRAPRSSYSLYPIEYLLYCVDCNQIRCPRCVSEELVTIYCPSCLFEVGASSVKTEGNRCFQCPVCVGPLAVQSLEPAPEASHLTADNAAPPAPGPWVLCCSYCNWSSSEIGVKFDKPQGIFGQLAKIRHGDGNSDIPVAAVDALPARKDAEVDTGSAKSRFAAMKSFYQSQLANSNTSSGSLSGTLGDYGYGSPTALSRIMSLYSGGGSNVSTTKTKSRPAVMREAETSKEGFRLPDLDEANSISDLRQAGFDGTVTQSQATSQVEQGARFSEDLWPIPHLLRSKRAKRCPACRHILSKPEAKVNNTRWRIRLVAGGFIPSISIKPLMPPGAPAVPSTFLTPMKPTQYLLTFKNLMFDQIKVSLATPNTTPGRFASRVTVLCPQFTIDANSDDYDINEVLKEDRVRRDRADSMHQAEPGKVWERGRNWVSIVVEVIPASLNIEHKSVLLKKAGESEGDGPLREDEDVLEIPMFVRLEWESDPTGDHVSAPAGKDKDGKEKRELAYWCVLGIGKISQE